MYTKKRSLVIWESVRMNMTPSSFVPALVHMALRSSFRSLMPYVEDMTICITVKPQMKAARRDRDCFPLPPTPTLW